jgi:hypothetical protein
METTTIDYTQNDDGTINKVETIIRITENIVLSAKEQETIDMIQDFQNKITALQGEQKTIAAVKTIITEKLVNK